MSVLDNTVGSCAVAVVDRRCVLMCFGGHWFLPLCSRLFLGNSSLRHSGGSILDRLHRREKFLQRFFHSIYSVFSLMFHSLSSHVINN